MPLSEESRSLAQEALSALIGLPLSDMFRYFGIQSFEFGEQKPFINRRGQEATIADRALWASCLWRIAGPNGFDLSWEHFGPSRERRDDHADPFYDRFKTAPLVVESVTVLNDGALRFAFSEGYRLALDPEWDGGVAQWTYMPPNDDPRGHLALYTDGRLEWTYPPSP